MSIRNIINNIKESNIYKLICNGKIVGLRVKYFEHSLNSFIYYDLDLDKANSSDFLRSYISTSNNLRLIELHEKGGLLISDDELANNIIIQEFRNLDHAVAIIKKIIQIKESTE